MRVVIIIVSLSLYANVILPCPISHSISPPVLAELRQAKLISAQECAVLTDFIELVRVQSDKSPELMAKTEDALRKCGLEKEFIATSGRQTML